MKIRKGLLTSVASVNSVISRAILCETPFLVFSLGLRRPATVRRLLESVMSCNRALILDDPKKFAKHLRYEPIHICVRPRLPVLEMWFIASRLNSKLRERGKKLGLIAIHDLGAIPARSHERRIEELKFFAREMRVPVVVLARQQP